MFWSKIALQTLRENPADAEMESHRLLVRGGYIKKLAPGIFSYGVLLLRSIRKFENIIREELEKEGSSEILMPMVQPAEIWKASGRWPVMSELLKFKNKNQQDFCLGATHEEAIVQFVKNDLKSYRDLPLNLFQIQTKYRDEIRPRFGLMRGREFIMKDAYSFAPDRNTALEQYEQMNRAYISLFKRLGVDFVRVRADSGDIGGDQSHEFQVTADSGMDEILRCSSCDFAGNVEVVSASSDQGGAFEAPNFDSIAKMEKFPTPNLRTIKELSDHLGKPASQLVKTFFVQFTDSKGQLSPATLLVPGDRDVNMVSVQKILGGDTVIEPLKDHQVRELTGASPGSCGPVGISKGPIIMDPLLKLLPSFIVGANKDDFHLKDVVPGRDFQVTEVASLSLANEGDSCPECGKSLSLSRGIEVGHIFYLGQKYSEPMGLKYLDKQGKSQAIEMGCYGVGVTRSLQAVVEQSHDKDGIIWPKAVAPFQVHLALLDPSDEKLSEFAQALELSLGESGIDVFVDDRDARPGIKFKDADLLGLPLRVVLGKRGFDSGKLELFMRHSKKKWEVSLADAADGICKAISEAW